MIHKSSDAEIGLNVSEGAVLLMSLTQDMEFCKATDEIGKRVHKTDNHLFFIFLIRR